MHRQSPNRDSTANHPTLTRASSVWPGATGRWACIQATLHVSKGLRLLRHLPTPLAALAYASCGTCLRLLRHLRFFCLLGEEGLLGKRAPRGNTWAEVNTRAMAATHAQTIASHFCKALVSLRRICKSTRALSHTSQTSVFKATYHTCFKPDITGLLHFCKATQSNLL